MSICVSFQPIYILRIRAPQKSTFYDYYSARYQRIRRYLQQRNFTRFSLSNFNHISILSNFTIPRSFGTSNPPHSAVLEAEGRAILGAFQAKLRESIRSSNSNPHLLVPRPPQKAANSLAALCHTNASALREKP